MWWEHSPWLVPERPGRGVFSPSGLDTISRVVINPALPTTDRQRTDRRASDCLQGSRAAFGGRREKPGGPRACGMEEIGMMRTRIGWLALLLTAGLALAPTMARGQDYGIADPVFPIPTYSPR